MEVKVCRVQGKTSNIGFIFSAKLFFAQKLCSVFWGISVTESTLRRIYEIEQKSGKNMSWTLSLIQVSLHKMTFQVDVQLQFIYLFIYFPFFSVDTIVLHIAFSACHIACEEELVSHIVQRFISCWDTDPAPGAYWSLAIFTAVTSPGAMPGLVGKCILFQISQAVFLTFIEVLDSHQTAQFSKSKDLFADNFFKT